MNEVLIGLTEKGELCRLSFSKNDLKSWKKEWPKTSFEPLKKPVRKLPKDILLIGTAFQIKVWKELLKIPSGKPISYGDMARRIGKKGAARAVGGALGANPVPLLVPCHRVIAADGSLGGFSGGLAVKKKLLASEGFAVR